MEWEVRIIEFLQNYFGGISKYAGSVFSFIGGENGLMVLIVVTLFCWKKEVGQRLALIIASLHVWLSGIKAVVKRLRPYMQYPDRVQALSPIDPEASLTDVTAQGYSFPSMHSTSVVSAYSTVAKAVNKKGFWIFVYILSLLVGFFRVATGNHYPTDVLAGWVFGFVIIMIFDLLDRYVKTEWGRHLILLVSALPGIFFVRTQDYYTSLGLLIGAVLAIPFERKYVNYEQTKNILAMVLRTVGGFALYFGLNTLFKLPFSKEFLASDSLASLLVRTLRYTIIMFVIIGAYPKIFPLYEKIGKKK